jgi:hypothetical protein
MKKSSNEYEQIIALIFATVAIIGIIGAIALQRSSTCGEWVIVEDVVEVEGGFIRFIDKDGIKHSTSVLTVKPDQKLCVRWS